MLTIHASIPVGSTATVHVPARDASQVRESGRPATEAPGVRFTAMKDGCAVFEIASGEYAFEVGGTER